MNVDDLTAKYIELRDRKAAIRKEAETREAEVADLLAAIETKLKEIMTTTGVQSVRTKHGTAYIVYRESATVGDWDVLLSHIRETEGWDLLERRVSKPAVQDRMEKDRDGVYQKPPPPGVNFVRLEGVNIRRS